MRICRKVKKQYINKIMYSKIIYTIMIIKISIKILMTKYDKVWQYDKVPPYFKEVGEKRACIFVMCIYIYRNTEYICIYSLSY